MNEYNNIYKIEYYLKNCLHCRINTLKFPNGGMLDFCICTI